VGDWLIEDSSMPTPETTRHSRINGRRPMRSAQGAINKEPAAMPNKPALSSMPICAPLNAHSADTEAAVKAITSTSKPSIMLSTGLFDGEPLERTHRASVDSGFQIDSHARASCPDITEAKSRITRRDSQT
jgi:hypothetical protein